MHGVTRWAVVTLALAALATVPATAAPRAPKDQRTAKVVAFHHAMDTLWTDHATWTRLVIVDVASGAPSLNADEIAAFLSKANPDAWPLPMMRAMMDMSMMLADGIVAQFPQKFS